MNNLRRLLVGLNKRDWYLYNRHESEEKRNVLAEFLIISADSQGFKLRRTTRGKIVFSQHGSTTLLSITSFVKPLIFTSRASDLIFACKYSIAVPRLVMKFLNGMVNDTSVCPQTLSLYGPLMSISGIIECLSVVLQLTRACAASDQLRKDGFVHTFIRCKTWLYLTLSFKHDRAPTGRSSRKSYVPRCVISHQFQTGRSERDCVEENSRYIIAMIVRFKHQAGEAYISVLRKFLSQASLSSNLLAFIAVSSHDPSEVCCQHPMVDQLLTPCTDSRPSFLSLAATRRINKYLCRQLLAFPLITSFSPGSQKVYTRQQSPSHHAPALDKISATSVRSFFVSTFFVHHLTYT